MRSAPRRTSQKSQPEATRNRETDLGKEEGLKETETGSAKASRMPAEFLRLLEVDLSRASVTGDFSGAPKLQDVGSFVGLAVVPQRAVNPAGSVLGVPGLHPGADALFELVDDAIGHASIDVNAGSCGSGSSSHVKTLRF